MGRAAVALQLITSISFQTLSSAWRRKYPPGHWGYPRRTHFCWCKPSRQLGRWWPKTKGKRRKHLSSKNLEVRSALPSPWQLSLSLAFGTASEVARSKKRWSCKRTRASCMWWKAQWWTLRQVGWKPLNLNKTIISTLILIILKSLKLNKLINFCIIYCIFKLH